MRNCYGALESIDQELKEIINRFELFDNYRLLIINHMKFMIIKKENLLKIINIAMKYGIVVVHVKTVLTSGWDQSM